VLGKYEPRCPPPPHKYPCSHASTRRAISTRHHLPNLIGTVDVGGSFTGLGDGVRRTRGSFRHSNWQTSRGFGCGVVCVVGTGTYGGGFLGTSTRASSLVICVYIAPSLVPLDHLASWLSEVAVEVAVPIHSLGVCWCSAKIGVLAQPPKEMRNHVFKDVCPHSDVGRRRYLGMKRSVLATLIS
jgi:hypothetical protein